jgi:hypothetical protein
MALRVIWHWLTKVRGRCYTMQGSARERQEVRMENWTTADIADQLEQPEGAGDARRGIPAEIRKVQGAIRALAGWVRDRASPVRDFAANEVGSAAVLLAAAVAALVWANSPWSSTYEVVWSSDLSFRLGELEFSQDLRHWINDGLMAFFFFVVGLEIRREFDMGELRDHRRVAIPVLAALGGMAAPALIYLASTPVRSPPGGGAS